MGKDARLVWLDMEMSGLDPDCERILEIAVLVTEGDLTPVADGPDLVVHQPEEILAAMDDWNREHHGASGLTQRVRESETSLEAAETEVLAFLAEHVVPKRAVLAGSSIHQDRRFIRRYMPRLDAFLHYRQVDVSTVKELVKRWFPSVAASAPAKKDSHRALEDIRESLAELAHYKANAFKGE